MRNPSKCGAWSVWFCLAGIPALPAVFCHVADKMPQGGASTMCLNTRFNYHVYLYYVHRFSALEERNVLLETHSLSFSCRQHAYVLRGHGLSLSQETSWCDNTWEDERGRKLQMFDFLLLMGCLNNAWSVETYSALSGGKKASRGT